MSVRTMPVAIAVVLLAVTLAATVSAQQPLSCVSKLTPCAQFLNVTTPPDSCCGPLKEALTNELSCMCKIYRDSDLLKAFHIDLNAALQLPVRCGMPSSTTEACKSTAGAPAPPPPPPAAPGASNRVAWMGMPGLMGLLLVWWSILA
ncbi:lipid transfer-like protein VAS isoform X1 [Iris pallida]|uniref:Lipid transfer-like protein VAS isoform X1 n=1 Tax=Iris pallida TaxID=29817 RepID=A0AAX6EC30_IRIPA|nr:lipid transfer-like protein VAS isoform X1 [Iris pallida]